MKAKVNILAKPHASLHLFHTTYSDHLPSRKVSSPDKLPKELDAIWDDALDMQKCYGCFYRALAVLKLLSAPVYGSRRHILLSCHSPVTITEMMIDNFLKNHQNIVHVSDPDTFLKGVCSSPDFLFDLSQPLLSALQWNSIFVQSPCVLLS